MDGGTPKYGAQAIRKAYDSGWHPLQFLTSVSGSVGAVLAPAGLDKAKDIVTIGFLKDPTDPQWQSTPEYKDWLAWMKKYYPDGNITDNYNVLGYSAAQVLVETLKAAGDDLTRANVMKQATNLHHLKLPMLLPGLEVDTGPTNYVPVRCMYLQRFDGAKWVLFGDALCG
jgi:hypothetical protein